MERWAGRARFDTEGFQRATHFIAEPQQGGTVYRPAVSRPARSRLLTDTAQELLELQPVVLQIPGRVALTLSLRLPGSPRRYLHSLRWQHGAYTLQAERLETYSFVGEDSALHEGLALLFGQDNLHLPELLHQPLSTSGMSLSGTRGSVSFALTLPVQRFLRQIYMAFVRSAGADTLLCGTPLHLVTDHD